MCLNDFMAFINHYKPLLGWLVGQLAFHLPVCLTFLKVPTHATLFKSNKIYKISCYLYTN